MCCDDICLGFGLLVRGIVIIDSCGRCFFFQISKGSTTCFVSIQNLKLVYKKKREEHNCNLQARCGKEATSHQRRESWSLGLVHLVKSLSMKASEKATEKEMNHNSLLVASQLKIFLLLTSKVQVGLRCPLHGLPHPIITNTRLKLKLHHFFSSNQVHKT